MHFQFGGESNDAVSEQAVRHGCIDQSRDRSPVNQLTISLGLKPLFQCAVKFASFGELPGHRVKPGRGKTISESLCMRILQAPAAIHVKVVWYRHGMPRC